MKKCDNPDMALSPNPNEMTSSENEKKEIVTKNLTLKHAPKN